MSGLLDLTAHLPEVELAAGDVLLREGDRTGSMWVLVSGRVDVLRDGVRVSAIDAPGAAFGEISVLLDSDHSATVVAASPVRLRHATDGRAFLLSSPDVLLFLAEGLAGRLDVITRYLADLRNQYAGAPGLDMVGDVLGRLVDHDGPPPRPGSARDPDPEY